MSNFFELRFSHFSISLDNELLTQEISSLYVQDYIEYFANSSCCFRMDFTPLWMVRNLEARCIKQMGKWWQSMSTFLPCVRKRKKEEITEKTKETIDSFFVLYIKLDANPRDIGACLGHDLTKKTWKVALFSRLRTKATVGWLRCLDLVSGSCFVF